MTASNSQSMAPKSLIGTFRRFGPRGPVYEVLCMAPVETPQDPILRIRVIESGEGLDYSLSEILEDLEDRGSPLPSISSWRKRADIIPKASGKPMPISRLF